MSDKVVTLSELLELKRDSAGVIQWLARPQNATQGLHVANINGVRIIYGQ